jgi:hypothetical protein
MATYWNFFWLPGFQIENMQNFSNFTRKMKSIWLRGKKTDTQLTLILPGKNTNLYKEILIKISKQKPLVLQWQFHFQTTSLFKPSTDLHGDIFDDKCRNIGQRTIMFWEYYVFATKNPLCRFLNRVYIYAYWSRYQLIYCLLSLRNSVLKYHLYLYCKMFCKYILKLYYLRIEKGH